MGLLLGRHDVVVDPVGKRNYVVGKEMAIKNGFIHFQLYVLGLRWILRQSEVTTVKVAALVANAIHLDCS